MAGRQGASERLAHFVSVTQWQSLPPRVRHEAKRCLVNYFATSLSGCSDPTLTCLARTLGAFSGRAEAGVIGYAARTDALTAAFLNAASANVFDFDDTHLPTVIHPTAPVAPVVFALAQRRRTSGEDLLLSLVLGIEVACRIGKAVHPSHYRRGWHITSTCGIFGAAAAASRLLGLGAEATRWAFGNALAQASGSVETLGTMSKSLGVGNSARNGLLSAIMAAAGFSGPARPLEGAHGFLRLAVGEFDEDALLGGLGTRWEILSNTYKPYPCGVVLNPVIEACLELAGGGKLCCGDIDSIEIVAHPLLRERTDRPGAKSGRASQVSAQHAVAVSLLRRRAGLAEFSDEAVSDPAVADLGRRLRFHDDDAMDIAAAQVTIRLRTGESLSRTISQAAGSLQRPLEDGDLERKLDDLASHGASGVDPRPIAAAIWALDDSGDAGEVMDLARGKLDA